MAESGQDGGGSSLVVVLALVATPVFIVLLLVVVLAGGGATPPPCGVAGAGGSSPGVGTLTVGGIPAEYVPLIQQAGTVCPEFPAPVIAAQLKQESGFADATSPSGAQGPAQFMPETWVTWGNGGNVHDPVAAVDAQARFDCALAAQVKEAQASGRIHSSHSVTELALGGYNAGFGAVLAAGDVPGNSQTQAYVPGILDMARDKFSEAGTVSAPAAADATGGGAGTQAAGCGGGQVQVRPVAYPVPGGTQAADLYVPVGAGRGTAPRPVVVMVHGGGFFFGDRSELAPVAKAVAEHGYYVLNIDYDLSAPRWPRQLEQVRAAIDYVRSLAGTESIDASRVALLGDSAGGGLVLEAALLGDHSGVQAVVSWSGPTDFTSLPAQALAGGDDYQKLGALADPAIYLGCPLFVCPDVHRQASPALSMTPGPPPTMLVSSDHELVPLGQLTELDTALRRQGAVSKTLVFPGDRHATAYTADANGPTVEWLDATLHFTPPAPAAAGGSGGGGPAAQKVVAAAQTQLGLPYIWGGGGYNGPSGGGFDCSGLTAFAFHQVGLDLPRTAETQYGATASTRLPGGFNPASYQPGDLLFWGTEGNIHHVAIAIGNGQLIQASTFGEPLNQKAIYNGDFFAATRPLGTPAGAPQ